MGWGGPDGGDGDEEFAELREDEDRALLRLFLDYGRGQLPEFVVGGVASILSMTMELVPALVLGVAIDTLLQQQEASFDLAVLPAGLIPETLTGQFFLAAGLVGSAYVLGAVLGWVNSWAWNHFAQHFQHRVRVDSYDAMQRRELDFFDNKQTGEVMSILNNDVNRLEQFLTNQLNTGITIVVRVGGMGLVMLLINWRLGIIPTLVIPALAYVSYRFVTIIQPKYGAVRSSVGALNSRLENNLGGIEAVKSYVTEEFETNRVEEASEEYLDANWDAITTRIKFWPALRIITAAGYMAVFVIGGWWVMVGPPHPFFSGTMSTGTLVVFLSYSRRFMWPMRQVGRILNDYERAQASAERIMGLRAEPRTIPERDDAVDLGDVDGRVDESSPGRDRSGRPARRQTHARRPRGPLPGRGVRRDGGFVRRRLESTVGVETRRGGS